MEKVLSKTGKVHIVTKGYPLDKICIDEIIPIIKKHKYIFEI
jgi:hypothetical protein